MMDGDPQSPLSRRRVNSQFTVATLLWAAVVVAVVLPLRELSARSCSVAQVCPSFALGLVAAAVFLIAYGKSDRRAYLLGAIGGAAGLMVLFVLRGYGAFDLLVASSLFGHDLQRFAHSLPGAALLSIGVVVYCALFTGAVRALFSGCTLVGVIAITVLVYWGYAWHHVADTFRSVN